MDFRNTRDVSFLFQSFFQSGDSIESLNSGESHDRECARSEDTEKDIEEVFLMAKRRLTSCLGPHLKHLSLCKARLRAIALLIGVSQTALKLPESRPDEPSGMEIVADW